MTLTMLLLVAPLVLLIAATPSWPYSGGWGYGPTGILGCKECLQHNSYDSLLGKHVMYKIQVQETNGEWHDVYAPDGTPLTFRSEREARAKLEELLPVQVKRQHYAGTKRPRVIASLKDEYEEDYHRVFFDCA